MAGPVQRSATASALDLAIMDDVAAHGGLADGEIVVHFDLVAETRRVDLAGNEHIERYHWAPVGSDPHLSAMLLRAEAKRAWRKIR